MKDNKIDELKKQEEEERLDAEAKDVVKKIMSGMTFEDFMKEKDDEFDKQKKKEDQKSFGEDTIKKLEKLGVFKDARDFKSKEEKEEEKQLSTVALHGVIKSKGFKFKLISRECNLIETADLFSISSPLRLVFEKFKFVLTTIMLLGFSNLGTYFKFYKMKFVELEEDFYKERAADALKCHPLVSGNVGRFLISNKFILHRYPNERIKKNIMKLNANGFFDEGPAMPKKIGHITID